MKLERIILRGLYCKPDENEEIINKRAISIPLNSNFHQIWAPNGYGKTLALKILSKLHFPEPESSSEESWERAFWAELRYFFKQPTTTESHLIRGREDGDKIPYFADINQNDSWLWSEKLQVLPFHTLYAIFIDIETDTRYILEWDSNVFLAPEKSMGYSITIIQNANKIPFLLEKEVEGEIYSIPTMNIIEEVNKLSEVYPEEVKRYESELFIERPSTDPESQIFDYIQDCRTKLSNFTLGYYEILDIISNPSNWFTFSHDILQEIIGLQDNEELPKEFRDLIPEFIGQWMYEINDRINESKDPWRRELVFDKRIMDFVFYDELNNPIKPEILSNGQRSIVTIETLLLLARVRARLGSTEVSYAIVIDEPETGLAEYWVDRLIERFRDIQHEFAAHEVEGFSLIILTHRKKIREESLIYDDVSKYSLMQPYHPEDFFEIYSDLEEEDDEEET